MMNPGPLQSDPQEEGSHSQKGTAHESADAGRPRQQDSTAEKARSHPPAPARAITDNRISSNLEIDEAGVILLVALKGPLTADTLAAILGIDPLTATHRLHRTVGMGMVEKVATEVAVYYRILDEGTEWLRGKGIGR